jgi:hypothetical protein
MVFRSISVLVFAGVCVCMGLAQNAQRPATVPVVAELSADMFAHRLLVGATVSGKVLVDWNGPGCTLPSGSTLQGSVKAVTPQSKTSKDSQVTLSFDKAACSKAALKPYPLILVVVAAPFEDPDQIALDMPRALGGLRSELSDDAEAANDLRYWALLRPNLQAGHVYGIRGLSISVGTANNSTLTAKNHDLTLFQHTQFLLIAGSVSAP